MRKAPAGRDIGSQPFLWLVWNAQRNACRRYATAPPALVAYLKARCLYSILITSHRNGWPLDLWSLRHFEEPMSDAYGIGCLHLPEVVLGLMARSAWTYGPKCLDLWPEVLGLVA